MPPFAPGPGARHDPEHRLAAPIAVAFADYLPQSALGPHAGDVFNVVHMSHVAFGALFFPYLFGPIFGFYSADHSGLLLNYWSQVGGFLTISLLILGLMAFWGRRHRPLRIALLAWLVVALGRTYGLTPLWRAFDLLPFMGHVGAYRYLSPAVSFAAVALAALGADDIRRGEVPRWVGAGALLCSAGVAAAAALSGGPIVRAIASTPGARDWTIGSLAWGFAVLAVIGAAAIVLRGRWRQAVVLTCVVVDAVGMYVVPMFSAPRTVTYDASLVAFLQHQDSTARFFTFGPMQANYGSYFGTMEADVNDLPVPKRFNGFVDRHLDTNTPLQFTGSAVQNPAGPSPVQEFVTHFAAYEAIGVRDVVAFPGTIPSSTVSGLGLRQVYSDQYAVVYATPHPTPLFQASTGCTVSTSSVESVTVHCTKAGTVVHHELYMAGWSARTATGHALWVRPDSVPGTDLSQSVRVPAGTSTVEFDYTPPHEGAALGAFCAGLLAIIIPSALWGNRRRRALMERRS